MSTRLHDGTTTLITDYDAAASGHRLGVSTVGDAPLYVTFADNAMVDAFQRLRTSELKTIFDSSQVRDDEPMWWFYEVNDVSGSATTTYLPNESSTELTVGNGDEVIKQSKQYFRYEPGKSQLVLCTFILDTPVSGLTQRVGYFDALNGIFLETSGTDINIVRRTSVTGSAVNNKVAQADWNIDPMDGTGPSGITLDIDVAQILIIDMEWLGVGRVRVGFVIDGKAYYVHEFLNSNNGLTTVYMKTASLPRQACY